MLGRWIIINRISLACWLVGLLALGLVIFSELKQAKNEVTIVGEFFCAV